MKSRESKEKNVRLLETTIFILYCLQRIPIFSSESNEWKHIRQIFSHLFKHHFMSIVLLDLLNAKLQGLYEYTLRFVLVLFALQYMYT